MTDNNHPQTEEWTYKPVPYKSTYKVYDPSGYCYIDVRTETEAKLICDANNELSTLKRKLQEAGKELTRISPKVNKRFPLTVDMIPESDGKFVEYSKASALLVQKEARIKELQEKLNPSPSPNPPEV